MGVQQLLYIILGIVIVSAAVVVGVQLADYYYRQSTIEQLILLSENLLDDAWTFYKKPIEMGGGGGTTFQGWRPPESLVYPADIAQSITNKSKGEKNNADIYYKAYVRDDADKRIYLRGNQNRNGRRRLFVYDYTKKKWIKISQTYIE